MIEESPNFLSEKLGKSKKESCPMQKNKATELISDKLEQNLNRQPDKQLIRN